MDNFYLTCVNYFTIFTVSNLTTTQMNAYTSTLLQQLGSRKFLAMTGVKNLCEGTDENGNPTLRMDIPTNAGKVNRVEFTLNLDIDLYTVHFYKMTVSMKFEKGYNLTNEQKFERVYFDQLQKIFTKVTGMYTSL